MNSMRIKQLPLKVANQIAAGEVIENPASVVKELLENAIDAQATSIHIEIGYGGLNQIKISDNGHGIMAEDLPLAIAAHATSKIRELKDLYSIRSMGFRGEALASIAAISRLTITSKTATQEHAMKLSLENEKGQLAACARSEGTTIEVRDIFYNAPVRKKFLKTERGEFQAIEATVKRFALSVPTVALSLYHNEKLCLDLPATHCKKTRFMRVRKLFGKAFVEHAIEIDVEHSGLALRGWIANAAFQRSQNDKQWVYVNDRMVKDKLLHHAIKQAYEKVLYPGRYPACVLYLTINPEEVDVNVHPTKHELRFQQPRFIHDFISSQLQLALDLSPAMTNYLLATPAVNNELQVRETYAPLNTNYINPLNVESKWLNLNDSFVLIMLKDKPYLVDSVALHRQWLGDFLEQQCFPLPSRPLLVPISHKPPEAFKQEKRELLQALLKQIGLELEFVNAKSLFIRSLPLALPHLELKGFLNTVFEQAQLPSLTTLLEWLIKHQCLSNLAHSKDEQQLLIDYLQSLLPTPGVWYKSLTPQHCRALLDA